MIHCLNGLLFLTSAYPMWRAWRANQQTSLLQSVNWAVAAWTVWGIHLVIDGPLTRYLALCVTGCAGVAVLGARRPGVTAWNFVVLGLLAVHLLPVAEGSVTGTSLHLDGFRLVFLSATLAVGALNYLPTRFGWTSLLAACGCALEIAKLAGADLSGPNGQGTVLTVLWLVLAIWVGHTAMSARQLAASAFDQGWLDYRDRFGVVWSKRLQEQFNNAALHAGWSVVLRWRGLRLRLGTPVPDTGTQQAMLATLRALMKRFGPEEVAGNHKEDP